MARDSLAHSMSKVLRSGSCTPVDKPWCWRAQVLVVFAQSPELCELIAAVEADYARFVQHPGRRPEGPYAEVLPFLAEQAQDWEAAALATSTTCPPVSVSAPSESKHCRQVHAYGSKAVSRSRWIYDCCQLAMLLIGVCKEP